MPCRGVGNVDAPNLQGRNEHAIGLGFSMFGNRNLQPTGWIRFLDTSHSHLESPDSVLRTPQPSAVTAQTWASLYAGIKQLSHSPASTVTGTVVVTTVRGRIGQSSPRWQCRVAGAASLSCGPTTTPSAARRGRDQTTLDISPVRVSRGVCALTLTVVGTLDSRSRSPPRDILPDRRIPRPVGDRVES